MPHSWTSVTESSIQIGWAACMASELRFGRAAEIWEGHFCFNVFNGFHLFDFVNYFKSFKNSRGWCRIYHNFDQLNLNYDCSAQLILTLLDIA